MELVRVASYFDSRNTDGDYTIGVRANYNENGEYSGTDVYGGFGDQHIYYNNSPGKENWVRIMENDARGIESVYPEMYAAGAYATHRIMGYTVGEFGIGSNFRVAPFGNWRNATPPLS